MQRYVCVCLCVLFKLSSHRLADLRLHPLRRGKETQSLPAELVKLPLRVRDIQKDGDVSR